MKPGLINFASLTAVLTGACCGQWTPGERAIIDYSDSLMTVMIMPGDSAILRARSIDLSTAELRSPRLRSLIGKMLYTVQDPSQDGVGIAAPQVGINRRIVCIQRFDMPGEPFKAFVNIKIDSLLGPVVCGPEGCLSVPGKRGIVPRHRSIKISYTDIDSGTVCHETVEGFTAVIFQHECDHLDGILYTDRADSLFTR